MFVLQLMVGKMLLPLTGGTPAGWIVAMAFFQIALLAGYALALWLNRFGPRVHGLAYLGLLVVGGFLLPVTFPHDAGGAGIDAWVVLRLLTAAAAIPAIALATTSSTLQRLFTSTGHAAAGDPYFLYAASNLGSMSGLLLYPFAIETILTLPMQSALWFCAYFLLAVLAGGCLLLSGRAQEQAPDAAAAPVTWKQKSEWMMLAFFPSSILLGVTMYITTDFIAAPLVWVWPLALYLLTYVIAFSKVRFLSSRDSAIRPAASVIAVVLAMLLMTVAKIPWVACWNLLAFTLIALMYHTRLAHLRPGRQHLSAYYLMIAVGGALGGIMNAFVAPLVFSRLIEYPVMMALACLLHPSLLGPYLRKKYAAYYLGASGIGFAAWWLVGHDQLTPMSLVILAIFALTAFLPRALIVAGVLVLFLTNFYIPAISLSFQPFEGRLTERNFYGVIKVFDEVIEDGGERLQVRILKHGSTMHGYQVLSAGRETTLTSYYAEQGPLGDIFSTLRPRKIAVIGLGAGTIACYATPENSFTFFELDPAVIDIAQTEFTFLRKCQAGAPHRLIPGDGRLELAKLKDEKFDLIILDAFSSDMVPAHLLTREALDLYLGRLEHNGAIAFHVTNRYLHLEKLLAASAEDLGLENRWKYDGSTGNTLFSGISWMVMSPQTEVLKGLDSSNGWSKTAPPDGMRPWTDNYSSILSIMGD